MVIIETLLCCHKKNGSRCSIGLRKVMLGEQLYHNSHFKAAQGTNQAATKAGSLVANWVKVT